MSRPGEDDKEAIDRAFAEMMAGYHLTSDRPDPMPERAVRTDPGTETSSLPGPLDTGWADAHPLFSYTPPPSIEQDTEVDEDELEPFVPPEPEPLPRPAWPVLVAWLALGYSLLMLLTVALGFRPPSWVSGLALVAFVGSLAVLFSRLPRHRPPDAGNGAVL